MIWSIPDIRGLQWLGHLGHMDQSRMTARLPREILFGQLKKNSPCHGTKTRWRDQISGDYTSHWIEGRLVSVMPRQKGMVDRCGEGVDEVASCRSYRRSTCAANRQSQNLDSP